MSFAMDYEQMKAILEKRLKASRFQHSLGVSATAEILAGKFGVDVEQAHVAGLLHDCAREFRNEAMIAEAERRAIPIGPVERAMPLLLHAYIGARRVREIYGVDDPAVEQAICECIQEGILREFLLKNRAEVIEMSIFEYNQKEEEELIDSVRKVPHYEARYHLLTSGLIVEEPCQVSAERGHEKCDHEGIKKPRDSADLKVPDQ